MTEENLVPHTPLTSSDLSAEVLENILQRLDLNDLKSYRYLDRFASDQAARLLLKNIRVRSSRSDFQAVQAMV
jgi:hypothetical protein